MRSQTIETVFADGDAKYQDLLEKYRERGSKLQEQNLTIAALESDKKGLELGIEERDSIIAALESKIEELKAELARHDNPYTPSSTKQPGDKGNTNNTNKSDGTPRKQGAQLGHEGTTNKPKPTIRAIYAPNKCKKCGDRCSMVKKIGTRNITNIQVTVVTTNHVYYEGYCDDCDISTEPPEQPTALLRIAVDVDERDAAEVAGPEPAATADMRDAAGDDSGECGQTCGTKQDAVQDSTPTETPNVPGDIPANEVQCVLQKLPKRGEYGLGVWLATVLSFIDRLPFRLNSQAWLRWGLEMSSGTVHNILAITGKNLTAPTADILRRIRKAYVLNADETSVSYNGKKVWIWIFHNPETGDTLIVIRPSRGGRVVREVLGKNWKGWLVCDGWTAYNKYRKQRCWAHILTAIRYVLERNPGCAEAQEVLNALREIYKTGCEAEGPLKERRRIRALLDKRVRRIVAKYENVPELKSFIIKLSNARPDLFQFVTDRRIPPTNNAAERGLREPVVHRKVRGALRAEETLTWLGNLFSCIFTWRERKMDVQEELAKYV